MNDQSGWSRKVLENVDKQMQAVPEVKYDKGDPAPTPQDVANEKLNTLLSSITTHTLDQLREMRDEIDNLMRAVQSRHDHIGSAFSEYVAYASSSISAKEIIAEQIKRMKDDFNNGVNIPKNVTVTPTANEWPKGK